MKNLTHSELSRRRLVPSKRKLREAIPDAAEQGAGDQAVQSPVRPEEEPSEVNEPAAANQPHVGEASEEGEKGES